MPLETRTVSAFAFDDYDQSTTHLNPILEISNAVYNFLCINATFLNNIKSKYILI
jgi:hypothetical protein